jgi:hypothetical protein
MVAIPFAAPLAPGPVITSGVNSLSDGVENIDAQSQEKVNV